MTGTPPAVTVSLLTRMLREAFEGPPGPWTYFTDTSPGTGVFGTIGGLSAAAASQEGGPGHTTIAGHVHHLSSSLALRWWTWPAIVVCPGPPSWEAAAALNPPIVPKTPVPGDVSVK